MPYYIGDLERDPNLESYPHDAFQEIEEIFPWFLSSPFIIRVPFFLLFGFSKGALK